MNKMQKALVTLTKMDDEWMKNMGINQSFRIARVDTRAGLKDLFVKNYTYESVMHLIGLRRKDVE